MTRCDSIFAIWIVGFLFCGGGCTSESKNEPILEERPAAKSSDINEAETANPIKSKLTAGLAPVLTNEASEEEATPGSDTESDATTTKISTQILFLKTLKDSDLHNGGKVAIRIQRSTPTYATWYIQPDGKVDATPWMTWNGFQSTGTGSVPGRQRHLAYALRPDSNVLDMGSEAATDASTSGFTFPLIAAVSGILSTPDHGKVKGVYRLYSYVSSNKVELATFTPHNPKKYDWIILICENMLSPADSIQGISRGDLDGDGLTDLAFIAEGVDGCDRPSCPLAWVILLLTDRRVSSEQIDALLFATKDVESLFHRCNELDSDSWLALEQFNWRTEISSGELRVLYKSKHCALRWQYNVSSAGQFQKRFSIDSPRK